MTTRLILRLAGAAALAATAAQAQIYPMEELPPHEPGTVCLTGVGWCWSEYQGTPGTPCGCTTIDGYFDGSLG